jgi:hypothetical protein
MTARSITQKGRFEMNALIRSCLLLAAFVALPAIPQEKAKAPAPKAKAADTAAAPKALVDNDKVKAYELHNKPGVENPARERPARVVRALTDGTMERIYPDGKKEKVEWKAGQVRWFPKENFGNKNIGKKDMVFYIVEPK